MSGSVYSKGQTKNLVIDRYTKFFLRFAHIGIGVIVSEGKLHFIHKFTHIGQCRGRGDKLCLCHMHNHALQWLSANGGSRRALWDGKELGNSGLRQIFALAIPLKARNRFDLNIER